MQSSQAFKLDLSMPCGDQIQSFPKTTLSGSVAELFGFFGLLVILMIPTSL